MPEAVIVSAIRTPVGRAYKGSLRATRPDDLAALAIKEALARVPGLDAKEIDDVILGCAMPEGEQGMNVARIAALRAGLPVETSAITINRFCSSGLQAGGAKAVDGYRAGFDGQARTKSGDARDVHALFALGHGAAEDHVVNFLGVEAGDAGERFLYGERGKIVGAGGAE